MTSALDKSKAEVTTTYWYSNFSILGRDRDIGFREDLKPIVLHHKDDDNYNDDDDEEEEEVDDKKEENDNNNNNTIFKFLSFGTWGFCEDSKP